MVLIIYHYYSIHDIHPCAGENVWANNVKKKKNYHRIYVDPQENRVISKNVREKLCNFNMDWKYRYKLTFLPLVLKFSKSERTDNQRSLKKRETTCRALRLLKKINLQMETFHKENSRPDRFIGTFSQTVKKWYQLYKNSSRKMWGGRHFPTDFYEASIIKIPNKTKKSQGKHTHTYYYYYYYHLSRTETQIQISLATF